MDGLIEWRFGAAKTLQVVLDAERAGESLVTLLVDGVPEPEVAGVASRR